MEYLKKTPLIYKIAGIILILIFLIAIFAPVIAPYPPNEVETSQRLLKSSAEHWLGTDSLGRDILSRLIYGARVSVCFGLLASASTMILGVFLGILGGYFGGKIDAAIQILVNIFQGLPGMSVMIALAGVLGPSIPNLLLAVTLTSWPGFSRIVRGEILKIREESYIEGIRALGGSHLYIVTHYIIPNILPSFIILFTVKVGSVVLSVASLSFLGLGIQPPQADWGVMVNDAKAYFRSYPNLLLAPGFCIFIFCSSINLIGDAIRDYFNEDDQIFQQYL